MSASPILGVEIININEINFKRQKRMVKSVKCCREAKYYYRSTQKKPFNCLFGDDGWVFMRAVLGSTS